LPELSVTVHVTVVDPVLKVNGALLLTDATEQLSETTGEPIDPENRHPMFGKVDTAGGQAIVGSVLSVITTSCVQFVELPLASVTVQMTSVVPTAKVAGALLVILTTEQLSEVDGCPIGPTYAHPMFTTALNVTGHVIAGAI